MKRAAEDDDGWSEDLEDWDDWDEEEQQTGGALLNFELQRDTPRRNWRNVLHRQRFQARIRQNRDPGGNDNLGVEVVNALRRSIENLIDEEDLLPHHLVHFSMQSNAFNHAFQSTTFSVQEFNDRSLRLDTYLNSLADKLNSNEQFEVDDTFTLETTFITRPGTGSGDSKHNKPGKVAIETLLKNKKSVVKVKNTDQLCCARAIVTTKCLADEGRGHNYDNLKRGLPIQQKLAKDLHRQAGVPEGPCGLEELHKFQKALPNHQIKVLSVDKPHCIIFSGPQAEKMILLIKVDAHYHGCNSFGGFLSKAYFCHDCDSAFDHDDIAHHRCKGKWCPSCESKTCKDYLDLKATCSAGKFPKPNEHCRLCNRHFFGDECYSRHLHGTKTKRSLCDTRKKCPACKKIHGHLDVDKSCNKKYKHKCGWDTCNFCAKYVALASHKCYIQPVNPEDDEPKFKKIPLAEVNGREIVALDEDENMAWVEKPKPIFIYADYEATTDDGGLQSPILICAETEDDDETLEFYGNNCTEEFMNHLDDLTVDEHGDERKVICVFHNFKGYDGMFILKYLYDSHRSVENQICIGTKVLSLSTSDITFKDSLCFLSYPLSQFPRTFGIEELAKGFFPHKFNTSENQDYEGVMPPKHFYDPEGMDEKSKANFDKWYDNKVKENYTFNMKDEMLQYCISDVKLLKAGCQKFQQQFHEKAEFNPMEKCITIASACNRYWRKMQLPRETIAVEPPNGWHGATTNQSIKALQWLLWNEHKLSKSNGSVQADRIKHSYNGGEVMVFTPAQSFRVDGFDELTNTVYEFHGCLWHGCKKCFPRRDDKSFRSERTFGELYEATKEKENMLFNQGYSLMTMWECQWETLKETDASLREFLSSITITPPLNPREAFFGGRTNAVCLYSKIDSSKGEQIRYVDVTSLYPWVNKYGEYPTGHPEIITNPENQDLTNYFGLAKVTILPPFQLYHPVLPYRCEGKLVFPLCKSCVQEEMQKPFSKRTEICSHTNEERALTGTWCTPEIMKAIDMGYTVITVHEVWHFTHKQTGLFSNYVNTWLKIKQESAGYPSEIVTDEDKQAFVSKYKERENIDLDPQYIEKNPGRKATAKLMLNSFWGKFGENLDKPTTASITSTESLFQVVSDPLIKINQIRICNDELLEIVYSNVKSNQLDNGKRNVFVAAFTTCHARLKLYSYLQTLNEQVLYFDTDSVVYKWKPGQVEIPLGDFLGEMTNELEDEKRPGDYISEFVSGGPKNYGYVTDQGAVCCKVRGFSLKSVRGSSQLNYTILRNNLLKELTDPREKRRDVKVVNPNFFTRDPASKRIKVIPRTKLYGLVFDKRVVDFESFVSFPYGFKQMSLDQEDIVMAELLCDL